MLRDAPLARTTFGWLGARRTIALGGALLLSLWLGSSASPALAQTEPDEERTVAEQAPWETFRLLEGSWEAAIEGRLGKGTGIRRYQFIFDGRYLVSRHASVRLPQEKSPAGDYHRELAVYSFDRERGMIVLREFIVEGYVLRYACQVEPKRFVCTSENVESGPGMRARLTVEIKDRYRFEEIFELAAPGKELELYFTNHWTRVPDFAD